MAREIHKFAEKEAVKSQLPGRKRGPADAYRHILGAAEATRRYGKEAVGVVGDIGETIADNTAEESVMDRHNNEVGIKIGIMAKEKRWTREQTAEAVRQKIIESKDENGEARIGKNFAAWYPEKNNQGKDNWSGNPKYDTSSNVEESKRDVEMSPEHMNWPNIDFNNPYHNNPYGAPPGFKPYVTRPHEDLSDVQSQPTLNEELRTQVRDAEAKQNRSDPNAPHADEVDPVSGKKFGEMRTGEYAAALYRKRKREAANGNGANDNATSAGGDVQVRAHDREGGQEHIRAYTRSKPKK